MRKLVLESDTAEADLNFYRIELRPRVVLMRYSPSSSSATVSRTTPPAASLSISHETYALKLFLWPRRAAFRSPVAKTLSGIVIDFRLIGLPFPDCLVVGPR
jgi:hypothetical protein